MSNDWFRFKQFTVRQSGSAMKVGTDGVLLGAWSRIDPRHRRYLDIGTGTGLIALMIAQRVTASTAAGNIDVAYPEPENATTLHPLDCVADGETMSVEVPMSERHVSASLEASDSSLTCGCASLFSAGIRSADVRIDAVEIDGVSAHQAACNVAESPWSGLIHVYEEDIREFASGGGSCTEPTKREETHVALADVSCGIELAPCQEADGRLANVSCGMELVGEAYGSGKYDHILSNPPWFVDSLHSPHQGRTTARHASSLPYAALIECVGKLLSRGGVFSTILPAENGDSFVSMASEAGLELIRRTAVSTISGYPPKRLLLEFAFGVEGMLCPVEESLSIETGTPGCFTEEYRKLTRDFYLKF